MAAMVAPPLDGLQILDTMMKINPWFNTGKVPTSKLELFKRREFNTLEQTLSNTEMATLIIGGRRVGKSVLMYQLIDSLLNKGVKPDRVLFIQGDNPILNEFAQTGRILRIILDIYQKYITKRAFDEETEVLYIFLDEAQNIRDWQLEVKSVIDLKYKVKFIITGSSSRELRQGAQNPMTGRMTIQVISPFSFFDFVRYRLLQKSTSFLDEELSLLAQFNSTLFKGDIKSLLPITQKIEKVSIKYHIPHFLDEYLFIGGFPWVLSQKKQDDIVKYLRDLLTATISKDIMTQVEIRDTQAFERLMVNICLVVGGMIKYKTLGDILALDERSVARYIDYYVDTHWAIVSSPYTFHRRVDSIGSEKKIYVIDNGIINTLAFKDESDLKNDKQYRSKVVENTIHNHLLNYKMGVSGAYQNSISFWREPDTGKEIDFILDIKGGVLPIEVKCRPVIEPEEIGAMQKFLKDKTSSKFGIITTEANIEFRDGILFIPYPILLFTL